MVTSVGEDFWSTPSHRCCFQSLRSVFRREIENRQEKLQKQKTKERIENQSFLDFSKNFTRSENRKNDRNRNRKPPKHEKMRKRKSNRNHENTRSENRKNDRNRNRKPPKHEKMKKRKSNRNHENTSKTRKYQNRNQK